MRFVSDLGADLRRLNASGLGGGLGRYFLPRGECFPYVFWLRVLQAVRRHWMTKVVLGIPVYIVYRHFEFKYAIHANANTEIGGGLRVVHGPCNLNAAKIGRNFTVYSGVTIGKNKGGIPTIGDDVSVYPNAVVVGGISIGDGTVIGALSYVDKNVPAGTKVIGYVK